MNIELALANLKRHGFDAVYFETAAQAAEYVAGELKGMSVGIGGSKTVEAWDCMRPLPSRARYIGIGSSPLPRSVSAPRMPRRT